MKESMKVNLPAGSKRITEYLQNTFVSYLFSTNLLFDMDFRSLYDVEEGT